MRNFREIIKKVISIFFLERSGTSEFTSTPLHAVYAYIRPTN